jgi:tetratricopeptide (TPR) repeat protein
MMIARRRIAVPAALGAAAWVVVGAASGWAASDGAALLPTTRPAAVEPAPAAGEGGVEVYDLDAALERLTPEELEALLNQAISATLEVERKSVAAEIKGDLLYEAADQDAAVKILNDDPAGTQADNISRICRAFARADEEFAAAYKAFAAGRFAEAAKRAGELLDVRSTTYLSAATHYLYAESLFAGERYDDAVDAYLTVLTLTPDRISFASASALRRAEAFEKLSRLYYATEMYAYCLENYGLTMDEAALDKVVKRLEYLQGIYKDPLGSVAKKMGEVEARLEKTDSGRQTQDKQQEIVRLLEDLIKTAEEQQQQQQQQQQANKQKGGKSGESQKPGQKGTAGQAASTGGRAAGRATKPAERSFLPLGGVARPRDLADPMTGGADDWARLPEVERRKIEQAMKRMLPKQYQQLIREYRIYLSKTRRSSP